MLKKKYRNTMNKVGYYAAFAIIFRRNFRIDVKLKFDFRKVNFQHGQNRLESFPGFEDARATFCNVECRIKNLSERIQFSIHSIRFILQPAHERLLFLIERLFLQVMNVSLKRVQRAS